MGNGRITVLVENTAGGRGLLAEHGLSFWVELGNRKVLFDTGQGKVLLGNARRLGIRLEQVDAIVLSHGHYDHTGGLGDALRNSRATTVYAHPAAFEAKYARSPDGTTRDIGMPNLDEQMVRDMAELVWVEDPTDICEGLRLTGPIPRNNDFEDTGGAFFRDKDCTDPDKLIDDQAAFIETPAGTVVILGCAHAGVINTLMHIQSLTNGRPIYTVIGGMHLLNASPDRMDRTVAELRRLDVQRLLPCHCTGFAAMARLWNELPGRCAACPVGTVVEVPGVNIKLMECGGLREALRMIHVARTLDMQVMLGCMVETSLSLTAAAHLSPLVDYADLDSGLLLYDVHAVAVHTDLLH